MYAFFWKSNCLLLISMNRHSIGVGHKKLLWQIHFNIEGWSLREMALANWVLNWNWSISLCQIHESGHFSSHLTMKTFRFWFWHIFSESPPRPGCGMPTVSREGALGLGTHCFTAPRKEHLHRHLYSSSTCAVHSKIVRVNWANTELAVLMQYSIVH